MFLISMLRCIVASMNFNAYAVTGEIPSNSILFQNIQISSKLRMRSLEPETPNESISVTGLLETSRLFFREVK